MSAPYKIFEAIGIELEYMIVDRETLDVRPLADELFKKVTGNYEGDVERDGLDWSNELVLHVVEIKNPRPDRDVLGLTAKFEREVASINGLLEEENCLLLSAGVHPWMNPDRETKLWPHGNRVIYQTYDRLFGCKGHGWSNLQSMHMNFPFSNDEEFEKLHTAIRCVLPLVPALCASSPIIDGKYSGFHSSRLVHYTSNQKRIPSIMGLCVPDYAASKDDYHEKILYPMYEDVKPIDPEGILQEEWLNSRGAIPKFSRDSMEIRLADIQEAPKFDIAIAWFWEKALKEIVAEEWTSLEPLRRLETAKLRKILDGTIKSGEEALIDDGAFLDIFGFDRPVTAKRLLGGVLEKMTLEDRERPSARIVHEILSQGTLATRLLRAYRKDSDLKKIYRRMTECLKTGEFFGP